MMSNEKFTSLLSSMAEGMLVSLQIFFLTLVIALPLGLLLSMGRTSKIGLIRLPVQLYLLIMRGTPLMLQLFFVYFGPYYLFGMKSLDRFWAAVLTFGLNYAAYFAEIFRAGIQSIPQGQYEAAATLGLTRRQSFFRIIFPQVTKRVLPPMGNEFMTLVKDTALARVIAVSELFDVAAKGATSNVSVLPYVMAAAFYLAMNFIVGQVFLHAEKRLSYYK